MKQPIIPLSPQAAPKPPALPWLWLSTLLVYFYPPLARRWRDVSIRRACVIGTINLLATAGWLMLILAAWDVCTHGFNFGLGNAGSANSRADAALPPLAALRNSLHRLPNFLAGWWMSAQWAERLSAISALLMLLTGYLTIPYFVLLPFAARPGSNKACVRHVIRTVLLGTGAAFIWGSAICGLLLSKGFSELQDIFHNLVAPLLAVCPLAILWIAAVLLHAVRREYRRPQDLPQPHEPTCDECGYILIAADPAGRCPECGKPVAESIGAAVRPPTAWEKNPSPFNVRVIAAQLAMLVRTPRRLFFSMPTLTGQRPAQLWLLLSMIPVSILAALLVAGLVLTEQLAFDWKAAAGALALGVAWTGLALMMVGIETTGLVTFGRMRGKKIYLATAAKVTCYAACLMPVWIVLGGVQALLTSLYYHQPYHLSPRNEEIALTVSLGIAHIGGLLWYELTVYRGIRAIQYANK